MSDNLDMSDYILRNRYREVVCYEVNGKSVYCVRAKTTDTITSFAYQSRDKAFLVAHLQQLETAGNLPVSTALAELNGLVDCFDTLLAICRAANLIVGTKVTLEKRGLMGLQARPVKIHNRLLDVTETVGYLFNHSDNVGVFVAYDSDRQTEAPPPTLSDITSFEQGFDIRQLFEAENVVGLIYPPIMEDIMEDIQRLLTRILESTPIDSKVDYSGMCSLMSNIGQSTFTYRWSLALSRLFKTRNRHYTLKQQFDWAYVDTPNVFTQQRADFCRYMLDNITNPQRIVKYD